MACPPSSGAALRSAAGAAAACLAPVLAVSGCGGGGPARPATVTVTASARTSSPATPGATSGIGATSTSASAGASRTGGGTAAAARLRITHRVAADPEGRPLALPHFTVTAVGSDPVARRAAQALQGALQAQVAAVASDWEAAQEPGRKPAGGASTEEVTVPVNEPDLAVVAWRSYVFTGGAHGVMLLRSVTVDVARGSVLTDAGLLAQLQEAGGPGWVFERELRAAVRRQLPDDPTVSQLTRKELHLYPTRAGLHVTGDQCVLACALPPIDVTIAWGRLVGPGDDIPALPDSWGL